MKRLFSIVALALFLLLAACSQSAPEATPDASLGLEEQRLTNAQPTDIKASGRALYVTGTASGRLSGSSQTGGIFLRKYLSNGRTLWTRQFGSQNESSGGVVVDSAGNSYVLSSLFENAQKKSLALRKYSANGTLVWTRLFGNPAVDNEQPYDLELNGSTLNVLTGKARLQGFIIYRYTTSGVAQGTLQNNDKAITSAWDIAFDKRGNLLVMARTGFIESNTAGIKVVRYNSSNQMNGSLGVDTSRQDIPKKIVVDSKNNIYLAWEQLRDTINITKFDSNFRSISNTVVASGVAGFPVNNNVNDMVITKDDSLYLTGSSSSAFGDFFNRGGNDAYAIRVRTQNEVSVDLGSAIQYGTKGDEEGLGIAISDTAGVVVIGTTTGDFRTGEATISSPKGFIAVNSKVLN